MSGADNSAKSRSHTPVASHPQQTTKVPRQVKVKDSRQIQTQDNDSQAGPAPAKKPNFREAAKAVGKGNREILTSKHLVRSSLQILNISFVISYEAVTGSSRG